MAASRPASFKDRASAVGRGQSAGTRRAGHHDGQHGGMPAAALAGLCASVGDAQRHLRARIGAAGKGRPALVFGSTVLLVRGTYDDAFELCLQAAKAFGWLQRNTGYNPYMTEGKKPLHTRYANN